MIKLVVFDMAGTTVDEDNVVYKMVRAAINAAGYRFSQEQVQAAGAGKKNHRRSATFWRLTEIRTRMMKWLRSSRTSNKGSGRLVVRNLEKYHQ